jgi:hypothetical protein
MKKVTVDYSDLLSVLDNLQYFVSHGFILDEEQTRLDQEVIDRLKSQMEQE